MMLIIAGGIGFLTWEDIKNHKWHFKKYRMQSKVIFMVTGILIFLPALYFFILSFQMCLLQKEYGFLCFNPLRREQQDSIRQI